MTRRHLMRALGLATGALALAGGAFTRLRRNRYYEGPVSDHFNGEHFFTPGADPPRGGLDLLRWQFGESAATWSEIYPGPPQDVPPARVADASLRVTCIGHASFLVQAGGHHLLIDPVWSERASPVTFAGPRRVNGPGVAFDALPRIDTVLVSHNHYDHLDMATLTRLHAAHGPRIITPLGNDVIIRGGVAGARVEAYDWWDVVALSADVRVHLVPTEHWSARTIADRRHALWASFVLETPGGLIYAVGDSGLGSGRTFSAIGARFPGLRLALLPIGAYEPRWFMRDQHMNPDDAVQALQLCGAQEALGHHWGTFQLTNEAIDAPPRDLAAALARHGVAAPRFRAVRPGEVWSTS